MLYGKPGTGKPCAFALRIIHSSFRQVKHCSQRRLARASGLDFAVMSGPSFDQFKPSDAIVVRSRISSSGQQKREKVFFFC